MRAISKVDITQLLIDENTINQRIDNFLFKTLKGVPKTHVYKIIRSGQVRVNSHRISASYRLKTGDKVRIPPVRRAVPKEGKTKNGKNHILLNNILHEDEDVLVINKPSGVAVHGGSGISEGVIEIFRGTQNYAYLELAHRLDKETSGVLVLAKNRPSLLSLHSQFRDGLVDKIYFALVSSSWSFDNKTANFPLLRTVRKNGERFVIVNEGGQSAKTEFLLIKKTRDFAMLKVVMFTGRTHQIRVHLSHMGFPIAGDQKYGKLEFNKFVEKWGVKRMMLHAKSINFMHPKTKKQCEIMTSLPAVYKVLLD